MDSQSTPSPEPIDEVIAPSQFEFLASKPSVAAYRQHEGRVIGGDARFKYFMAVTLDPRTNNRSGIVRCIMSRDGDVAVEGYVDRSELHRIDGESLEQFAVGDEIVIRNSSEIIFGLTKGDEAWDFLGFEDPDIWIDPDTQLLHLYFTIPFKHRNSEFAICLGHAVGQDVDSLVMTQPALLPKQLGGRGNGAKEVSIAPKNSRGVHLNLIESAAGGFEGDSASVAQIAAANDMGGVWEYGDVVFNPLAERIAWIAGHASPGPLLPRSFIDIGEGKAVGIMNGREANRREGESVLYGTFSVGLFIYDYENGAIDWVSPEPLIRDSEARTITFASQFVEAVPGQEGILYAHVDDSFVRAYTLYAEGIRSLLP
ncbi:MAG: hypothetical protein WAN50_03650 [Minisyncoccia bacterium]